MQFFQKKSLSGEVLALALHLGVFGAGLHPDGPGCPEKPETNPVLHAEQTLLQQLSQKINPLACPYSCPTPWCLWCWTSARWSWSPANTCMANIIILNNSYYCNFSKKSISEDVQVQILKEPVDASHAEKTLGLWVIPQDYPRGVVVPIRISV